MSLQKQTWPYNPVGSKRPCLGKQYQENREIYIRDHYSVRISIIVPRNDNFNTKDEGVSVFTQRYVLECWYIYYRHFLVYQA